LSVEGKGEGVGGGKLFVGGGSLYIGKVRGLKTFR
jgi:hypothetical protein